MTLEEIKKLQFGDKIFVRISGGCVWALFLKLTTEGNVKIVYENINGGIKNSSALSEDIFLEKPKKRVEKSYEGECRCIYNEDCIGISFEDKVPKVGTKCKITWMEEE